VGEAIVLGSRPQHLSDKQLSKMAQPKEFEITIEKIANEAFQFIILAR
jgi:hypothetical protein